MLEFVQIFDQWSESPVIFRGVLLLLFGMFVLYISFMYLLIFSSYEAFNADDLDKTSRQKLQFEKVIIPIL